ncbi:MAG: Nucleic acid binding OB-fold tRNA/helicase-type, partial [Parcubacteria group bacterium Athens1014_26]
MIIKEFLPNPVGADKDGEYIKIFNDGISGVSLAGWKLKDASGKSFSLVGNLKSGQELTLSYSQTKINLNNNGETVYLYDNTGKQIDKLSYSGAAEEGKGIMRQELSAAQTSGKSVGLTGVINKQNNTA